MKRFQEGVHSLGDPVSAMWKRSRILSQGLLALVGACGATWDFGGSTKGAESAARAAHGACKGELVGKKGEPGQHGGPRHLCFSAFKFQDSSLQVVMSHQMSHENI